MFIYSHGGGGVEVTSYGPRPVLLDYKNRDGEGGECGGWEGGQTRGGGGGGRALVPSPN